MRDFLTKDGKSSSNSLSVVGADGMDVIPAFTVMSAGISIKSWCSRKLGDKYVDETDGTEKVREVNDPFFPR